MNTGTWGSACRLLVTIGLLLAAGVRADELDDFELDATPLSGLTGKAREAEVRKILARETPGKDFEALRAVLIEGKDSLVLEEAACELLLTTGDSRCLELGKRLLGHPIAYRQAMGARLLGTLPPGGDGRSPGVAPLLAAAAANPADADLRFALAEALGTLGDPAARPILAKWADENPRQSVTGKPLGRDRQALMAHLALALTGEREDLASVLEEADGELEVQAQLAHELVVMAPHWSPGLMANARREYAMRQRYLGLVSRLFERVALDRVVAYLKAHPESRLLSVLFLQLRALAKGPQGEFFPDLAMLPNPEFQAAVVGMATHGRDGRLRETGNFIRPMVDSESFLERALVVRLLPFPEAEQAAVVTRALGDPSAYVVEEALRTACHRRLAEVVPAVAEAGRQWPDSGRIQLWVDRYNRTRMSDR